uniref:Uncharacterized protein n=1 Tax=Octopus bimaculoides TaxID=37653 RepID=A0A0L8I932_OCTBM
MLEEFQEKLQEEETSRSEIENKLEKMSKILLQVKSGIDHLADRLSHLKTPKGYTASTKLSPSSNEYVLDQLALCEEKLLKLMDDFHDVDLEKVQKQMEDEEFHINIESRLPAYNTRVKLSTQLENIYAGEFYPFNNLYFLTEHCCYYYCKQSYAKEMDKMLTSLYYFIISLFMLITKESESSREDEPEVLSRSAIKKISQSIIDAKMKKDMPRRRKKTK